MLKAVIFDLDETLMDRRSSAAVSLKAQYYEPIAQEFRETVCQEQYAARYFELEEDGLDNKSNLYPALVSSFGLPSAVSGPLLDQFRLIYTEMLRPTEGARELLQDLRKLGLPCAIISNGEWVVQSKKIEVTGLVDLIEFALLSGKMGIRQPDRAAFRDGCGKTGRSSCGMHVHCRQSDSRRD